MNPIEILQIPRRRAGVDRERLAERLDGLRPDQLALLDLFTDQILSWQDPEVVETFLAWRSDPRIGSILELAAALSEEDREQLLFAAEDIYSRQPKS
jgi:hypothetical protein